jgi:hypothetical protein
MISHACNPQLLPLAWAAARAALPAMSTASAWAGRYHGRKLQINEAQVKMLQHFSISIDYSSCLSTKAPWSH